jgi:hypothetical protein
MYSGNVPMRCATGLLRRQAQHAILAFHVRVPIKPVLRKECPNEALQPTQRPATRLQWRSATPFLCRQPVCLLSKYMVPSDFCADLAMSKLVITVALLLLLVALCFLLCVRMLKGGLGVSCLLHTLFFVGFPDFDNSCCTVV